jgi:hypothetical protein
MIMTGPVFGTEPGASPPIVSHSTSAVKFTTPRVAYVVRFKHKNIFFYFEKML